MRGVDDLLDAVHMRGEGGDDHAARGGTHDIVDRGQQICFGGHETRNLGVGGVRQEQVHAFLPQTGEAGQVGDAAVQRELVHLEVARGQHGAGTGADRHGQAIGDGVVHGQEFEVEGTELLAFAFLDLDHIGLDPVFLQLGLHERQRQTRGDQWDICTFAQQVRDATDMVFVAVGEHEAHHIVQTVTDGREVRQDHVDAGVLFLGEEDTTVDDEQLATVFEDRHVAADLAEATQGHDPQGSLGEGGRCLVLLFSQECPFSVLL